MLEGGVALAAVLAAGIVALGAGWVAMGQTSAIAGLVVLAAPVAALLIVVVPRLGVAALAALVTANAGLVLQDQAAVPNVEAGVSLLLVVAMLLDRRAREVIEGAPTLLVAFAAYAAARVSSALASADIVDPARITRELALAAILIIVIAWAIGRRDGLVWASTGAVAAAGLISLLSFIKRFIGVGGDFFGFAGDVGLSAEQMRLAVRSLSVPVETRAAGSIGDPNFFAQSLVLLLPLGIWLAARGPNGSVRLTAGLSSALMLVGIGISQSRGGLIALMIALILYGLLQLRGRRRLLVLAVPAAATIALFATGTNERAVLLTEIANPREATDPGIPGRTSEQLVALAMIRDAPLTGVGPDQYSPNYREYAVEFGLDDRALRTPHNAYLGAAAETGAPGLITLVALLAVAFWTSFSARTAFIRAGRVEAGAATAIIAGLGGYVVAAIFLHLAFPSYLWLALGFILGLSYLAHRAGDLDEAESGVRS